MCQQEHREGLLETVSKDTIGDIYLERYRPNKYDTSPYDADTHSTISYTELSEGDLVIATSTESYGKIFVSPDCIEEILSISEYRTGSPFSCWLCGEMSNHGIVDLTADDLALIAHEGCIDELLEGSRDLIKNNKSEFLSDTI